jgi:hypothetical protein
MAIRGTLTHRKTRRLAAILKIELCHALGLIESLWHLTFEQTPCGDIGKISNQDIADELYTSIPGDVLIKALLEVGFIEEHTTHRLIVHDWQTWSDQTCKRKVIHRGGFVESDVLLLATASNCYEKLATASLPVPETSTSTREESIGGFCNKTPPTQTDDNPSKSSDKPTKYKQEEQEELWKELLDCYPSRGKADRCVAKGKQAYFKLIKQGENPEAILLGTQGYAAAVRALGNDGTSYVKQLTTYFNNRTWEEYLGTTPTNGKPKPPHLTALQMADGCSYVWSEEKWKLYTPTNDWEIAE